jgi:GT2 family glycosyltransferase
MIRTDPDRAPADPEVRTPTVLAVLVVKDGSRWLRDCLQGLASQSYPRVGILAVDNGSTDTSTELLERALGAGRVLRLTRDRGVAGAVQAALDTPVAAGADYLFVVHDDTALEPDTIARLVDAAQSIDGAGVVGPKVVDWDDPRILREVGRSTDRFGHPSTPLQDGEVDHGQYDRVLEVLFVSSCAMLVRREVWRRAGALDERLTSHHEDLDFCWRARLAGYRVIMTPLARVRHESASTKGARPAAGRRRSERYYAERAALTSMLKNYGVLSLLWLLPLYALIGVGRALLLALSRRFEDSYDVVAAWGWNVAHLPGTVRRRFRAQSVRTVKDRDIRRFMESATVRLPRWLDEASAILSEQIKIDDDEPPGRRLRARTRSLLESHPVLVGGAAAAVVGFLVAAPVLGADPLTGGVTPAFPSSPASFFRELASGVRTTALGGAQAASPALGALGGLSWALLGSTELAHRVLVVALPFIAAAMCYRAVGRHTGERLGATVAAGVYGSSAVVLWAFSQGRIDLLVALAVLPVLVERIGAAFTQEGGSRLRTAAGLGVALGIGISFLPGMLLPVAVVILVHLVTSPARLRGLVNVGAGVVAGAALAFPLLPAILTHPSPTLASLVGDPSFWALARTVLGPGPGSWSVAAFLPIAALVSIVIVRTEHRAAANRLALVGVAGIFLAWSSAAGYLPEALSNAPSYVALVAVAETFLVGFGVASLASGFAREAFGIRQILAVGLTALLVAGLSLQALGAIAGSKEIGQDRLPPAWPVVSEGAKGDFRVLWIGRDDGRPFPAPGGDPSGVVEAGPASLRYGLTDREGVSALDIGRRDYGGGYETLERTLEEAVSGGTRRLGALLAPFGVRYVVAGPGDLPASVRVKLGQQLDLDRVPALGLAIYRSPRPFPPASVVTGHALSAVEGASDLAAIEMLPAPRTTPLHEVDGGWTGTVESGESSFIYLADQFADGWELRGPGSTEGGRPAFGWATGIEPPPEGGPVTVSFADPWSRTPALILLGALWIAGLWATRRPVTS